MRPAFSHRHRPWLSLCENPGSAGPGLPGLASWQPSPFTVCRYPKLAYFNTGAGDNHIGVMQGIWFLRVIASRQLAEKQSDCFSHPEPRDYARGKLRRGIFFGIAASPAEPDPRNDEARNPRYCL